GATIAPVILASDKTQLSTFSVDKQAWPVYLTIGNIDKDVRRKPSRRAVVLLGYLPVTKLHCFHENNRALQGYRVFHYAMRQMLAPLIDAGRTGVWMTCADGYVRRVFPLLAAYIADHPEQCLVCCTKENRCPTCLVERDKRGDLLTTCYRDPDATKAALQDPKSDAFKEAGLRDIPQPFWADLPHANIFNCIVPDLLHQLHKGVFMTHLVNWVSKDHEEELDARFARVPPYPNMRIFSKGISTISQWTGNEYRQMEKVFIGLIDGLHDDPRVMTAARAILDFTYLAHYPSHSVSTLEQMRAALESFHANKQVFIDKAIRTHFNIPKLHWMLHYISSIIDFGSCDGLSTEISERLHIDFAKLAYRASNRKDYIRQMIVWLTRREKIRWFQGFLRWCSASSASQASGDHVETSGPQWQHGDSMDEGADDGDSASRSADSPFGPYTIARKPGLGFLSGSDIVSKDSASDFGRVLHEFLSQECGTSTSLPSPADLLTRSYAVYKKFDRTLPSLRGLTSETYVDTVFAYPAQGRRASRYSTVLFLEKPEIAENLADTLAGYRVGQVRAIFSLPPDLQRLRPDPVDAHAHLAYVELYTPFKDAPEPYIQLYKIMRSYREMKRHAVVLPVQQIFRSCHLLPVCGSRINRAWTSDTVLEECDTMYLNSFSDHHMYLFV
ncbi:hypothetical protein C8T65DRAFT_579586, partial [Cerioporus squamosus]